MARRYGKANKLSDSTEIPFTPDVFQVTSSEPMPIEPPDTASLTAMPELFPPTVIANDIDWRQHPKWKPLVGTPSRSTPIPKGTLVPDPSPARTFSDGETSTLMDPSPAGSYIHRRRQGEYVKRPPIWSPNGLAGENSPHLLENKDLGFDTSSHGEDIPFPLKVSTNLPVGQRQVSKHSITLSNLKLPSYSCEDQLNQMATAFNTDPFIVNVAQDITYTNLSTLEASTETAIPGPIIEQWVRNTPPPQEENMERSSQRGTTELAVDPSLIEQSYAVLPTTSNQGRSGLGIVESEAPIESADDTLPSVGQVIRSNSDVSRISAEPGDSALALHAHENRNRPGAQVERSTENHRAYRYEYLDRCRDIRTAPPAEGDMEYVHWIVLGSRVTCVDATFIATASNNDDRFDLSLGHQYLVSKIFDDQWALCIRCDIDENLKIHLHGKSGKSIRKKIMNTLRSKPKKPTALPRMEKVEYDRHIINFLPLCAVTLEANYEAYLEISGAGGSTSNSSSSRTRVRDSQRSPPQGGIIQAPERTSSQTEAVKIREAGFVEVPEHIYIASHLGPDKEPYVSIHTYRNRYREEPVPAQLPDGQDTAKQPFKSLGRYIGEKSVRGKKAWKDATQRLRKGKSFGDLLERPGNATTEVEPAVQDIQTDDIATGDQASDAPSNELSAQAPEESFPRATNRAENGSGESREPLLPPNSDATAVTTAPHDGANDSIERPTNAPSLVSINAALQTPPDARPTDPDPEQQNPFTPEPATITDLDPIVPASTTPSLPPYDTIAQSPTPNPAPTPAPSPSPSPPTTPPAPTIPPAILTIPQTFRNAQPSQPPPSVSHIEFIGEPDSFFDLAWGVVAGLNDRPVVLPR